MAAGQITYARRRPDRVSGPVEVRPARTEGWSSFAVAPLSPSIGAEVTGLDLARPLAASVLAELTDALHEWKVLFFREQTLDAEAQMAFARQFGEIEVHPFISQGSAAQIQRFEKGESRSGYENEWHNDNTWRVRPSRAAVLRAVEVPPVGGDTLFADMAAAYDNLPEELKERIDHLWAEHDWMRSFGMLFDDDGKAAMRAQYPTVRHPVVRTHPGTGRRTLYVNANFTQHIEGLDAAESRELLDLLYRQADRPEYQCRFRWAPGSVAFWDNCAVQHYAASDYRPQRRVMERVAIVGDVPR